MKAKHILLLITLSIAMLLLSGCTGSAAPTGWAGVLVDGDTIYVSYNTQVFAVNGTNGQMIWRYPEKTSAAQTFFAPPVMDADQRLVVGSYNKSLYLLDANKPAQPIWAFDQAKNTYAAAPLVLNGRIYAPNTDGNLYVLDSSGSLQWKYSTEHALWGSPINQGNVIYLPSQDHTVYALDADNGNVIWQTEDLGGAIIGSAVLSDDGRLFVGTLGRELVAISSSTGAVEGSFETQGWVYGSPLFSDGKIFFGDLEGYLYVLNASDLSEVWRFTPEVTPGNGISGQPLLVDNTVYFTSENGTLYALDSENGNTTCKISQSDGKPLGKLLGHPILAGDKILVTPVGTDAHLVAFGFDCTERWSFIPPK